MTNKHKPVVDPDSFDEGTHGLEVHERALAAEGVDESDRQLVGNLYTTVL